MTVLNVTLTAEAAMALNELRTVPQGHVSKAQIVNRALIAYATMLRNQRVVTMQSNNTAQPAQSPAPAVETAQVSDEELDRILAEGGIT